ncbi:MAG: D-aminoacylase [Firmicutes bacterium]|nr:D-aminoacylase [Bacillota bacterium]
MYQLLIKNARIIDGTGSPWYYGDLAVSEGKIVAIGQIDGPAEETVNADGAYLSPGFIDIHSHSDRSILSDPKAESRILQGVTTEVTGNCGSSVAPESDETMRQRKLFTTFKEYLDAVEETRPSVNTAALVGHGTIRDAVMGYSTSEATAEQIEAMQKLTAQAMEDGAFGISTGLIYPPSCYASQEELVQVISAVKPYGGYYATHMRNENRDVVKSVKEALDTAKAAGVKLQISHHKVTCKADWRVSCKTTIAMIERARRQGQDVTCDQYPYSASATGLSSNIPAWAFEGGIDALVERLKDPVTREKLKEESNASHLGRWGDIYVATLKSEENQWMIGKSITEIAEALGGKDYAETCFDIVIAEKEEAREVNFGMCEEDIEYIMSQPFVMPGSDGSAMPLDQPGKPHPRNYGTFVRVLSHYCRDRKLFSLETAVQKMTALPAARVGLGDRGVLKQGMWADLVLFDLESLKDDPDYKNPQQPCSGIRKVYVNGVLTAENGVHTGAQAGMVLRRQNHK